MVLVVLVLVGVVLVLVLVGVVLVLVGVVLLLVGVVQIDSLLRGQSQAMDVLGHGFFLEIHLVWRIRSFLS